MSRSRWSASRHWPVQCLPSCRSCPSDWIEWWSMELVGSVSNLPPPVGEGGREEKSSKWRWLKVELALLMIMFKTICCTFVWTVVNMDRNMRGSVALLVFSDEGL
jgi:hypothetical protein